MAESFLAADEAIVKPQIPDEGGASAAGASAASSGDPRQQLAVEYFQEYEMTFSSKPNFSLVEGADGKGAVVSWDSSSSSSAGGGGGDDAVAVNGGGAAAAPATPGGSSTAGAGKASSVLGDKVPPPGAVVIAVAGKSVVDRSLSEVVTLFEEAVRSGSGDGDLNNGNGAGREKEQQSTAATDKVMEEPEKLSVEVPPDSAAGDGGGGAAAAFSLVVRFREKAGPGGVRQHETGAAGGEVFRNRMKAMATGLGNFFQVKETGGSVVRDGLVSGGDAGGAAGAAASDSFVLTFSAANGTAEELPFTMAEAVGGFGVIVAAVRDDYAESLVKPEEAGVVTAGTAGVAAPAAVAVAAAAATSATGEEGVSGQAGANGSVGVLEPGAVLLRVAGQNVEGRGLQRVRKVVEAVAAEHSSVSEKKKKPLVADTDIRMDSSCSCIFCLACQNLTQGS